MNLFPGVLMLVLGLVASQQYTYVEIGRGVCRSYYYNTVGKIAIPNTTPNMTLVAKVINQYSNYSCVENKTYGITTDNLYLWITGLCHAEFAIYSVVLNNTSTTTVVTTTTAKAATTTPASSTTTSKAATTTPGLSTTTKAATTTTATPTTTTKAAATTTISQSTTTKSATTTTPPSTTTTKPSSTTTSIVNSQCGVANSSKTCEYPWMVMIYDKLHQTVCSGSIIDERHILTAAHCFVHQDPTTGAISYSSSYDLTVYTGSSVMPFDASVPGVVSRNVVTIATHRNYDPMTLTNDIALLDLNLPITFDTCHKPICLVDGSKTPQMASGCRAMGWGLNASTVVARDTDERLARALVTSSGTYESTIKWADVPVVSDTTCQSTYGTYYTGSNFCAGSSVNNSCRGDSCGPLACKEADGRYYQYGIVVAGDCGYPGLYTKVSSFLPWIEQMKILMTTVA